MKAMSSLLIILGVLLFLSFAEAKDVKTVARTATKRAALDPLPDTSLNTILPYSQFMKLTTEKQESYITGLQHLVLKLQKEDETVGTGYQSAQSILSWLLPEAAASGEDRRCVYAGWISEMDINGKHCMTPKSDGCRARGEIQCNPLLYGAVSCVKANRGATAACEAKKKSQSQIVREIKGKEQEWSNMREDLSSYCKDPRPSQGKVCALIRNQLARLGRVIGDVPSPRFAREQHDQSGQVDHVGGRDAEVTVSRGGASEDGNTIVVAPTARRAVSKTPASEIVVNLSSTRASGDCNPATLLANLKPESRENATPSNFMDLQSAQDLMCSTQPIDLSSISQQRSVIDRANALVRGSDKYANADRRNYQGILRNFNACVRDAQTLRRSGAPAASGSSATLVENGNLISIYDANNRAIVGLGSRYDLEGLLRGKGISLCNLRTRDSSDQNSGATYSSPSTYAPSGSAQ